MYKDLNIPEMVSKLQQKREEHRQIMEDLRNEALKAKEDLKLEMEKFEMEKMQLEKEKAELKLELSKLLEVEEKREVEEAKMKLEKEQKEYEDLLNLKNSGEEVDEEQLEKERLEAEEAKMNLEKEQKEAEDAEQKKLELMNEIEKLLKSLKQ